MGATTETVPAGDHLPTAEGPSTTSTPTANVATSATATAAAASAAASAADDDRTLQDVRIATVGNVDSGKSTLVGVLTAGELDDGRGLARERVVSHRHETATGRTSTISSHICGFDADRQIVHQKVPASAAPVAKTKGWTEVVRRSQSLCTFIDLCGHEKYLKTTIAGLTGSYPDYAMIIVNSLAGVLKMTKEHLGVVLALDIPFFVVVTKIDLCPPNVLKRSKKQLFQILKHPKVGKLPIQVRSEADIDTCFKADTLDKIAPVFFVSCVAGDHIDLLTQYLGRLQPRRHWINDIQSSAEVEVSVDDSFTVTGVGLVVSGTVSKGVLQPNMTVQLGPFSDGTFMPVLARSIHCKRVPVEQVGPGETCAVAIRAVRRKDNLKRSQIRRGMVLVTSSTPVKASREFDAEVRILHHPTTIKEKYQAVIHCGIIRQSAAIDHIVAAQEFLRTGDSATVRFRFISRPEFLHPGSTFVFREGNTKGIGRIVAVH